MKGLNKLEILDVVNIARAALECNTVDELRRRILYLLELTFNANSAIFASSNKMGDRLDFGDAFSLDLDNDYLTLYTQYYCKVDPVGPYIDNFSPTIITPDQFIPYKKLEKIEIYNDLLKKWSIHYGMCTLLKSKGKLLGGICLSRPKESVDFSSKDRAKASLLAPHIAGALEKAILAEKISKYKKVVSSIFPELPYKGLIVLDESLVPIYMNEDGINIISKFLRKEEQQENPFFCLPDEIHFHCQELQKDNSQSNCQERNIVINGLGQQILVHLRLIIDANQSPTYLVCLELNKPTLYLAQHLKGLGLTQREMEVVSLVCQGLKNSEIAEKLFISEYTVQTHLTSIYEKCKVKNRTTLIYLAMHLTGINLFLPQ